MKNGWLCAAAAVGLCLHGRQFAAAAGMVLIPSYLLFRTGLMGAGDGKMMAVIAGYLGLDRGLCAIGAGMAVGACWSLVRLWRERDLRATIPLAACLACGTYGYLLLSCAAEMGRRML